jgi:hypothetical protein
MRYIDRFALFLLGLILAGIFVFSWLASAFADTLADQLIAEVHTHGTKAAMDLLERLTKENPEADREQHALVHELGKANYAYHKDVQAALAACDTRFWSGCYHGTLQAYFQTLEHVGPQHMSQLCPVKTPESAHGFLRYNCLHGAGHGLAIRFDYDLTKALAHCDLLPGENWDRESCYGGAFMENIVSYQQRHHHGKAGFLTYTDLHYPCSIVATKYAGACWMIQTSAILTLTGRDWGRTFAECEKAGYFREACLESLGRDISGTTLRNHQKIAEICGVGTADQRRSCERGAVKDVMFHVAQVEPGRQFCAMYAMDKPDCEAIVAQAEKHLQ